MTKRIRMLSVGLLLAAVPAVLLLHGAETPSGPEAWQGGAVLTVAESKRLIAKGIAQVPVVKKALEEGTVIVTSGTTNTYVAEELLGKKIEHGAFVTGRVYPQKDGKKLDPKGRVGVVVIRKGKHVEDATLDDALKGLKAGDVVMKGANALDYENKTAGVLIGHSSSGTTGKVMPYVVARKAHLVIPVGLEKQVSGNVREISEKLREPVETVGRVPSMFLMTGEIVTEIEALEALADVEVFQAAAGGIGGAEGSVRLIFRGTKTEVERALEVIKEVQGEPAFVE